MRKAAVPILPASSIDAAVALLSTLLLYYAALIIYSTKFSTLSKDPGPWFPASTSLWIRWHRWQGNLAFTADRLLSRYGPVVRISPSMVVVNDSPALQAVFTRHDLDTAPRDIRALRVGGHLWTIAIPELSIARERRRAIMGATITRALKYWHPVFEDNVNKMIATLGESGGKRAQDIVHVARRTVFQNAQMVVAGSKSEIDPGVFAGVVGNFNFLVVWRLILPAWAVKWLKYSPFKHVRAHLQADGDLFQFGHTVYEKAQEKTTGNHKGAATVIDALKLAAIFWPRPPAAFTASRLAPKGGINMLGYQIPEGTIIATQSLSMSRQRPGIFPDYDTYDPTRWLNKEGLSERRKCVVPFGIGARRCPGSNMALYQLRLVVTGVVKAFKITVAPESSTPDKVRLYEANGFRCGPKDECFLLFQPR
ncbi:cytochrome P450 monooxygenase [Fusarium albosuccineum]|uniref:Cytochrome P450 monooxygenase n=1 Tax=Fusarium albosuccineum TaxID=1237068 RepID=A0A8H4LL91_9HYPO|nr:cytochrome P450 monooxygenase [Fusarium albosuccineum]